MTATAMPSKKSPRAACEPKAEVARQAIQLAGEGAAREGDDHRAAHVGFYLIDKGLAELERTVDGAAPLVRHFAGWAAGFLCCCMSARSC